MRAHGDALILGWIAGTALVLGCSTEDELDAGAAARASSEQALAVASCTQESDCTGGLACIDATCRTCSGHAQCESDVCDQGAATRMGPGACLPEAAVIYVDAGTRPACTAGDGSRGNPLCDIRDAIPRAIGAQYAIRVYPGHYFPFGATDRTFSVFGPGDGSAVVGEEDITAGARISGARSRVVLDGLDFGVHVLTGVVCDGASLKVLRGSARGDVRGIRATNCALEVDRVRAGGAIQSGLTIAGTGSYRITNSYFSGGDAQAVVFDGSSTGTFQFNTVGGGGELQPGGIACGTTARVIQDSIVVGSTPAAGGAQTVGACTHRRVVVGSGDTRPDPALIKIDPALDPEGRLLETPASLACCIDRGARYVSSLYRDFFGTPRPQGASNDIGAHELPRPGSIGSIGSIGVY
ncbi:MAG TPA: hypothetical protein VNO30_26085 [Kofleriaceae bacterium]|nr:hypothetical protein [Kofleriaceae bacterium]